MKAHRPLHPPGAAPDAPGSDQPGPRPAVSAEADPGTGEVAGTAVNPVSQGNREPAPGAWDRGDPDDPPEGYESL